MEEFGLILELHCDGDVNSGHFWDFRPLLSWWFPSKLRASSLTGKPHDQSLEIYRGVLESPCNKWLSTLTFRVAFRNTKWLRVLLEFRFFSPKYKPKKRPFLTSKTYDPVKVKDIYC